MLFILGIPKVKRMLFFSQFMFAPGITTMNLLCTIVNLKHLSKKIRTLHNYFWIFFNVFVNVHWGKKYIWFVSIFEQLPSYLLLWNTSLYRIIMCIWDECSTIHCWKKTLFFLFEVIRKKNVIKSGILYDFSMSTIINTDNFHMIRF